MYRRSSETVIKNVVENWLECVILTRFVKICSACMDGVGTKIT